jgi:tetratricopeptide (TPR) repeat protein
LRQVAPDSGRPHPDNDLSVTWCSRCRCPPGSHEEAAAATERAHGNDAYEAGEHERALLSYTRAITAAPGDAALWSNRAAVFLALRRFPQALHDAERATALEPRWAKPRARAAAAHAAMGQVCASSSRTPAA